MQWNMSSMTEQLPLQRSTLTLMFSSACVKPQKTRTDYRDTSHSLLTGWGEGCTDRVMSVNGCVCKSQTCHIARFKTFIYALAYLMIFCSNVPFYLFIFVKPVCKLLWLQGFSQHLFNWYLKEGRIDSFSQTSNC